MIELEFKPALSEKAKFIIMNLGGISQFKNYYDLTQDFKSLNQIDEITNEELKLFYQIKSNPPKYFLQFKSIINHYLQTTYSNVKIELQNIFEIYNMDLNESFDSFYLNIKKNDSKQLREKYKLGPSKFFKVCEILNEIVGFQEYLNSTQIQTENDINYHDLDVIINNFIKSESKNNAILILNAKEICVTVPNLIFRLDDEKFIEHIISFYNDLERSKFILSINNLKKIISTYKFGVQKIHIKNVDKTECFSKIKEIHAQLESLYDEYINLVPINEKIKKSRLQSDVGMTLRMMKKIENTKL